MGEVDVHVPVYERTWWKVDIAAMLRGAQPRDDGAFGLSRWRVSCTCGKFGWCAFTRRGACRAYAGHELGSLGG